MIVFGGKLHFGDGSAKFEGVNKEQIEEARKDEELKQNTVITREQLELLEKHGISVSLSNDTDITSYPYNYLIWITVSAGETAGTTFPLLPPFNGLMPRTSAVGSASDIAMKLSAAFMISQYKCLLLINIFSHVYVGKL